MVFSSGTGRYNSLIRGIGIALCPLATVHNALQAGRLVALDWQAAPNETTLLMVRHAEKWCSPLLSSFIDIVRQHHSHSN